MCVALGLPRGLVSRETFPLSEGLATRLECITDSVYNGHGFFLLRGIDSTAYTDEEKVIMYAGITSYVANNRTPSIGIFTQPANGETHTVVHLAS